MLWKLIAWLCAQPIVASWLIGRARCTPYIHLPGYMHRFWLFNAYPDGKRPDRGERAGQRWVDLDGVEWLWLGACWATTGNRRKHREWLPSIRVHHILRRDLDRHPHNHPWTFRSILLRGWYIEERNGVERALIAGDTYRCDDTEFHRIKHVGEGGVWTLFISGPYQHTWGFQTDDGFVPYKGYLE